MAKTSTTSIGGPPANQAPPERGRDNKAQAPIRWPKPNRVAVSFFLVWLVGVILALPLPGFIVNPGEETAPTEDILLAGGLTVVGCLIMMVSAYVFYRRTGEIAAVMFGAVPAFSCLAGGVIIAATKLTATGTGVG
jgi:hypothetical protein